MQDDYAWNIWFPVFGHVGPVRARFRLRGYVFYDFNEPEELPEADATLAQALCWSMHCLDYLSCGKRIIMIITKWNYWEAIQSWSL